MEILRDVFCKKNCQHDAACKRRAHHTEASTGGARVMLLAGRMTPLFLWGAKGSLMGSLFDVTIEIPAKNKAATLFRSTQGVPYEV